MKQNLFTNTIIPIKEGDNRTFEEYESEIDYNFIRSLEGICEFDEDKVYKVKGSHTDSGELAVLVYGYEENLDIPFISEYPISDKVSRHGHKGFKLTNVISDKRLFDNGETEDVWVEPFPRYVAAFCDGYQYDDNGETIADERGLIKLNYLYDYVWVVTDKDNDIPFKSITEEWEKITDNKYIYYVKWINQ